MPNKHATALASNKRAAAARLMEAVRDSLAAPLDPEQRAYLIGYVQSSLDRGALARRQGRPDLIDRATSDLDRYLAKLVQDGETQ
jgi:hypothetical protein